MCFEEILGRPQQVTLRTSLLILKYYWERLKAGGEETTEDEMLR